MLKNKTCSTYSLLSSNALFSICEKIIAGDYNSQMDSRKM